MGKTIQELFDETGAKPGELLVHKPTWNKGSYFQPFFKVGRRDWYGLRDLKDVVDVVLDEPKFHIWKFKKPKIKRWFWTNTKGLVTFAMYSDKENEGNLDYPIKLLWSETEFEDE